MDGSSANTPVVDQARPIFIRFISSFESVDRLASIITILHEVFLRLYFYDLLAQKTQHTDRPFVSPLVHLMGLTKYDIFETVLLVLEPLCARKDTTTIILTQHVLFFFYWSLSLGMGK
jgi:hypothetical protein